MAMKNISQNYGLTEPSRTFALIDSEIDSYLYLSPYECSKLYSLGHFIYRPLCH